MNREYYRAIAAVLDNGVLSSPRGMRVLELQQPYTFKLEPMSDRLAHRCRDHKVYTTAISTLKPFHTRLDYAEAELRWYLSGSTRIDELIGPSGKSYTHLWKQFSDDGVNVNSAYGQYIFSDRFKSILDGSGEYEHISQWLWVKKKLQYDSDSRQAIINISQPRHKETPTKDFPCCIVMMFTIRDGKLNLTTVFRSQDVDTGLRNDVYTMYRLQGKMAQELGIRCGTFMNVALNLHLYESKWGAAQQVINDWRGEYGQNEPR